MDVNLSDGREVPALSPRALLFDVARERRGQRSISGRESILASCASRSSLVHLKIFSNLITNRAINVINERAKTILLFEKLGEKMDHERSISSIKKNWNYYTLYFINEEDYVTLHYVNHFHEISFFDPSSMLLRLRARLTRG